MISIYLTPVTKKVMSPQLQCIYHCSKFKIMHWVILFMRTQLSGGIGNYSSFLHQDTAYSLTRGIAINHEILARIQRSKHWCRGQLVLEGLETFLTFVCPLKLNAFVKQISQWLGYL